MHRTAIERDGESKISFTDVFSSINPRGSNIFHLRAISQSFDDLKSETLYSKWKKGRKNDAKVGQHKSLSLVSLSEEDLNVNRNDGKLFTNSLVFDLRRQIFKPRGLTVCSGESMNENNYLTITSLNSTGNLSEDAFGSNSSKFDQSDTIRVNNSKSTPQNILGTSEEIERKIRSVFDSDQRIPMSVRIISDSNSTIHRGSGNCQRSLSYRGPRELEFLQTAEMAQRYFDAQHEDVWKKRIPSESSFANEKHKRIPEIQSVPEGNYNLVNIQDAESLDFPNDRSQPDSEQRYDVLNSVYGLMRQPQPQRYLKQSINNKTLSFGQGIRNSTQDTGILLRTMSEPSQGSRTKELSSSEEKEKDERSVSFKDVDVIGSLPKGNTRSTKTTHTVRRAQTLPRMPKRPLTSFNMKNWKDNELRTRKAANDFLENIHNSSEKSREERVDVVEKAFEWIRKEVADLRAQDKDIMRMFTKIQAGIRHIKFDQTSLMESDEDFISTPDLSQSGTTSSPLSKDDSSVPRRASLL